MFYQLRRIDTGPGKVKNKNIILDFIIYSLSLILFFFLNCPIDVCKKQNINLFSIAALKKFTLGIFAISSKIWGKMSKIGKSKAK